MATRAIKGVLARNDWQFFESACSIAFVEYAFSGSNGGLLFYNNTTVGSVLDVYRAELSLSNPDQIGWAVTQGQTAFTPAAGAFTAYFPLNLAPGQPTGLIGAFTSATVGSVTKLRTRWDSVSYDHIELKNGGPFISLPPGWGVEVILGFTQTTTVSMTVWYQVMSDQIVPAS